MIFFNRVAFAQQVGSAGLPNRIGAQRGDLLQGDRGIRILFQLVVGEALLIESARSLIRGQFATEQPGTPLANFLPLGLSKRDVADCSERGCFVGRVLQAGFLSDEEGLGFVLLAVPHEALPLQHDDPVAGDQLVELALGKEGGQMRDGLSILFLCIVAQGQPMAGQVRLGVIAMLLQEFLKAADGRRIELPIVGTIREEIEVEGWVLFLRCGGRAEQQREQTAGAEQRCGELSRHRTQPDESMLGCHAHYGAVS